MSDLGRLFVLAVRASRSPNDAQRAKAREWFDIIRDDLLRNAAELLESEDPTVREGAAGLLRRYESAAHARNTEAQHRLEDDHNEHGATRADGD